MRIQELLRSHHVRFEKLLHRPAPCSSRRAQSLGVAGDRVAKAVLVKAPDRYVLAVLPASCRINWPRLAGALGHNDLRLASEEEVCRIFHDCERGAIPPFGLLYGLTTIVDTGLCGQTDVVLEGELRHLDFRMSFADFEALEVPLRGRFADPAPPCGSSSLTRQAG